MPTTFSNSFKGGNPPLSGAAQHHNEVDGRKETIDAAYLNRIENAIVTTQTQINTVETTINTLITILQAASGAQAGSMLLGLNDLPISGSLPSQL